MNSDGKGAYPTQAYNQPQGYAYSVPNNAMVTQPQHASTVVLQPTAARPPDYMILSIVSCFFCWPMALCALLSAHNSRKSAEAGDFVGAESKGRTARNIAIAAIVIGIIAIVAVIVIRVVYLADAVAVYTSS